ncbi:class I SAM-dependent methyltransferase [Spongiactinospora sp. TRM90649]|uniref:class I SAM-dependent methyltransferase n=1 Tax=Spongiactinospora sp. TRM90649 TaxID=3031114 RepID=UPI0023F92191|nr:class I SAM-dependent methyltransferase [Spongiactinospora sp. TRM90649]MDF5751467.1 class I SAM-dependent methyltransferase [Spongiactinospora sp. TRM90649]
MNLDAFLELLTSRGQEALAAAEELVSRNDPVAAATSMRRDHPAELAAAALTQAGLRSRAVAKFGHDAGRMYFTPDGLEQATRPEVAGHRARRVAAVLTDRAGDGAVADVCCGIGGDAIELARAGLRVLGLDRDPLAVAVARANAAALGLASLVEVRTADAADVDPHAHRALFIDPARRSSARRIFDPMAYSPPLPQALALASAARGACLKVAPGLPYEFVPEGSETEWVSYRGEVKEAVIWLGEAAGAFGGRAAPGEEFLRRATLLPSGETMLADPDAPVPATGPAGRYLFEPDGAAIRAHLVAEIAASVGGWLLDPRIAYITGDEPVATPWASCYEIEDVMPFSLKRLRAALRERKVGTLTVKKRGSAVDVERLRRDLRLSGDNSLVVVLTRIAEKPITLLCTPVPAKVTEPLK